jgi:hypothetical protein
MSLNELTGYYPRSLQLRRQTLRRNLIKSAAQIKKNSKSISRRTRSKTLSFARRQYYPTTAYADLRLAATRNEDIFITALILLVVLTFSITTTGFQFLLAFLGTATAVAEITHVSGSLLLLITFAVPAILISWVAAFLINMFSITLMDGATRKVNQSVRLTARRSLRAASRTANAWFLLLALLATGPISLLIVSSLYLHVVAGSKAAALTAMPYAVIASALWFVYVLAQYSLVPSVALFESDLTLRQVLGRSRQLVKRRGRVFSIVIYFLAASAISATYLLASLVQNLLHIDKAALVSVGALAAVLGAHGLMVMLYRKRKLARKN